MYAKILAYIYHDQVWQFYGNCQTLYSLLLLSPLIANLFKNVFFLIFDIIYSWKAQLLLYCNQEIHSWTYLASKRY